VYDFAALIPGTRATWLLVAVALTALFFALFAFICDRTGHAAGASGAADVAIAPSDVAARWVSSQRLETRKVISVSDQVLPRDEPFLAPKPLQYSPPSSRERQERRMQAPPPSFCDWLSWVRRGAAHRTAFNAQAKENHAAGAASVM
jgi:hypothetical protein